jgi:hypothetical protein
VNLPAPLTDPWFAAAFYGAVAPDGRAWTEKMPFAASQGLFLWCPCGYGLLDKAGKERFPLDLSLNLGRPHGLLVPFANGPGGVLPADHGPIAVGPADNECWHGYITGGQVRNA